ncbi:MAG TPA: hypothetical protein DCP32_10895 [Anaerolineaceae bacterium]|nr:MAG: hypothetical protein A2X24_00810 [Chloroflexi bacterium GWB2_54_36]HAL17225.1 hypothetical protein [Anaerolineaceae bacterium]
MNQLVSSVKAKNLTVWIIVVILLQAGVKIWALIRDAIPFNADEAVVALMAKHILQGERPIFFYGQAYMGSADAYLVAAGFWLFGEQIWVIRLVQSLLYLGTILTTMWIVARLAGNPRAAAISGVLLAVPAVNMTLYTTASLGGYGEALLLGNIILIAGFWLVDRLKSIEERKSSTKNSALPALILGLFTGLGLWVNGLTLVYAVPMLVFILYKVVKARIWRTLTFLIGFGLAGVLIGALPWWLYAAQNGFQALTGELFGSAIAVEGGSYASRILSHISSLMLLGSSAILGLRPPWEVNWIVQPLIPAVVGVWAVILYAGMRKMSRPFSGRAVLAIYGGIALTLAAAFIFTSFGADPSGRYFLPVQIALAVVAGFVAADWTGKKPAAGVVIVFLLVYQSIGNIQSILQNPPGLTTQFYEPARLNHQYMDELIQFLDENRETRGYTNYWISYPLAFKTDEKLIFVPHLPYHPDLRYTSRDDRYPPYDRMVEASQRIAYVTSKNPELDRRLRSGFVAMDVTYKETKIGDYRVFYALSAAVRPEELAIYPSQP